MSDITAVVLSIGEETTARAIESAARQRLPPKEIITVRNVSPFYKAMNFGASRVTTEFFVQIDSDMILDDNCLEDLRACMREEVGLVLGFLRDPLMGRIGWVKMFRTECFEAVQYKDLVSQDLVFKDDISKIGWNTVVAIRPLSSAPRELWHTFGEHRPAYTPHYTYSKYLVEGRKYRYRKALASMQWHIKMLTRSAHPMALIAEIALAHGIFIRKEQDLLQPYARNEDFEFLESFFETTGSYNVSRISVVPLLNSSPEKTFEKNYRLGISLRQANAFPAFTRCMEWLSKSHDPLAWLAKIGLCHGLFADAYDKQTCAAEYALLRELLPSDAAHPVLKARLRMFYRRHIRSHASLVSRLHADRTVMTSLFAKRSMPLRSTALAARGNERRVHTMQSLHRRVRSIRGYLQLPRAAKIEQWHDRLGLAHRDPGVESALRASLDWICQAQDHSASGDGGVASHFSLLTGWGTSYPETTGYIIPTMLAAAAWSNDIGLRQRTRRMVDWLVSIQFPDGGFQGGWIGVKRRVPVSFNTGQILLGLATAVGAFGDAYREPLRKAADWLVATQDADGCWRKYPTPLAEPGDKSYEAQIAWGLLEAARIEPKQSYSEAALAKVRWALTLQKENGWFDKCCFTPAVAPLTHTLGYALRAVLEAYRFSKDGAFLEACTKTADGLLKAMRQDGFIPGRLYPDWRGAVPWTCLTGNAQIACCWLILHQQTGAMRYRDAAFTATRYLRRTVRIDGSRELRGGIKGSFPVYGDYCPYEYINWACKFFIDANLLEAAVRQSTDS